MFKKAKKETVRTVSLKAKRNDNFIAQLECFRIYKEQVEYFCRVGGNKVQPLFQIRCQYRLQIEIIGTSSIYSDTVTRTSIHINELKCHIKYRQAQVSQKTYMRSKVSQKIHTLSENQVEKQSR